MLVITDADPPWPPCGICRQVISEFASPELPLHFANLQGRVISASFGELLPNAYTPEYLEKGGRKIDAWYSVLEIVEVLFDNEPGAFSNINTETELRGFEAG